MCKLEVTNELKWSRIYKEIKEESLLSIKHSYNLEDRSQRFLQKRAVINKNTGEVLRIEFNFDRKYKAYINTIHQKCMAIQEIAHENSYISLFLTFTLPSKFHPFSGRKEDGKIVEVNSNYLYPEKGISRAIEEGYALLNEMYRVFYKRIKSLVKKDLLYIKVFEPHKNLLPHLHTLFFTKKEYVEKIKKIFFKVKAMFDLKIVDFVICDSAKTGIYIRKYITKKLRDNKYAFIRMLDGWKKRHKIRLITTSILPISQEVYKKLYYNLKPEEKQEINIQGMSYYKYFIDNTKVFTNTIVERELDDKLLTKTKNKITGNCMNYKVLRKIYKRHQTLEDGTKKVSFKVKVFFIYSNLFQRVFFNKRDYKAIRKRI